MPFFGALAGCSARRSERRVASHTSEGQRRNAPGSAAKNGILAFSASLKPVLASFLSCRNRLNCEIFIAPVLPAERQICAAGQSQVPPPGNYPIHPFIAPAAQIYRSALHQRAFRPLALRPLKAVAQASRGCADAVTTASGKFQVMLVMLQNSRKPGIECIFGPDAVGQAKAVFLASGNA